MNMDVSKAREVVCSAGKRLLSEGLVARTWGNVSVRVSERQMVITPSGRKYQELLPEDMVLVDIYSLEYQGLKPSSELKLHAEIYKKRPEVGAVIHTHQMYGSIVAAAQQDVEVLDQHYAQILGTTVVKTAPYALPNTKKITYETVKALGTANAALMANHGVVCVGYDIEQAFEAAITLEKACEQLVRFYQTEKRA